MTRIKSIENKIFELILEKDEDGRFVVKYKNAMADMQDFTYSSFLDLKTANIVFDKTLINLEGH